jgi:hypothetical protein
MASQPSAGAKTSKWGSFLTGLESRLDTILADEDVTSKPKADGAKPEVAEDKAVLTGPRAQHMGANSTDYNPRTSQLDRVDVQQVRLAHLPPAKPKIVSTSGWRRQLLTKIAKRWVIAPLQLPTCHQERQAPPMWHQAQELARNQRRS